MFYWDHVNFAELLCDFLKILIVSAITAVVTYLICKHYAQHISFAKKMKEHGFEHTVVVDQINFKKIFKKADTIKMMYVSAYGFFEDLKMRRLVEEAAKRGAQIQFLFAKQNTQFIKDIETMERNSGLREQKKDIKDETDKVYSIIQDIKKNVPNSKIEVRYFSTEYRMPIVIADYKKKNQTHAYLNITFPPARSKEHILLSGVAPSSELEEDETENIVKFMNDHFESVWENSSQSKD